MLLMEKKYKVLLVVCSIFDIGCHIISTIPTAFLLSKVDGFGF